MKAGHVYCIELSNGCVKIGKSISPNNRIKEILRHNCNTECRSFVSDLVNHTKLELDLHRMFDSNRLLGSEKFTIDFDYVCDVIKKLQLDDNYSVNEDKNTLKSKNDSIDVSKNIFINMFYRESFIDYFSKYHLSAYDAFTDNEVFDDDGIKLTDDDKYNECIYDLQYAYKYYIIDIMKLNDIDKESLFIVDIDGMIEKIKTIKRTVLKRQP